MNTITAKELRDYLGSIAKRVEAGEHIYVSYRNKLSFELVKPSSNTDKPNTNGFVRRVNERRIKDGQPAFDPDKSIKQLYHEMLDKDLKYQEGYDY